MNKKGPLIIYALMIDFEVKYFILIYKLPKYIKFDMFMF